MNMFRDYASLRKELEAGNTTAEEVVRYYLENIEKGKHLNAFLSVFGEGALEKAKEIDRKFKDGTAGKLAGMVVAIKDVLSIKNKTMTCASRILEKFIPLYTCTAVQRLIDEDAIVIGKTNCDEFAMGSSNENSAFGVVKNPADESRVPGGSIRQPASFCGITGVKPTYGRVSRYGLTAHASSFDTIGPFANNVSDCARILEIIAGHDKFDSTSMNSPVPGYSNELELDNLHKELTIGYVPDIMGEGLQSEIKENILNRIDILKSKGFTVKEVKLPHSEYSIQTYYILITAELSSNLARYDGARYGRRAESSGSVDDMYVNSRTEGFGTEVKRRIMLGTYVLSAGYYDAYYKKAQKVRRLIRGDFQKAFKEVDVIIIPTTPTTAFKIGEMMHDPLEMYLNDVYTTSANLSGNPAMSIPAGKDKNGLPVGMQIIGDQFGELNMMRMAEYIMRNC
jgi:aspartyl-tRNA(Asn)/glutamyl-tRNA(Gln) amidotransferase subunit A